MWIFRRRPTLPPRPRRAPDPVDEAAGCGWFESSHELQRGCVVQEHADPAAVAGQLPLGDWIDLWVATGCKAETRLRDDRGLDLQGEDGCVMRGAGGSSASAWP